MKKIFALFLVVATLFMLVSCGGKLDWPNSKLGNMIPHIDGVKGEIGYNHLDSLHITLEGITENQYFEYIEACKNKGFSTSVTEESGSFTAFNKEGYKIDVSYFSSGDMWITVDAPISMDTFEWPNSDIAKLLPKPNSNYGRVEWEADYGFVIYVGNTTKTDYQNYVNAVRDSGFTVDYSKGDDYYYADNADGYSVNLKYKGFNTMFVRIDVPNDETSTNTSDTSNNNSSEDTSDNKNDPDNNQYTDTSNGSNNNGETNNGVPMHITVDNNIEFKNLLNLRDPMDASVAVFANAYANQIIEFDGCILAINNHGNYNTRYDILIGAGNYSADSVRGPNFRLTDVGTYDMNLGTLWAEDVLYVGVNIHVIAEVGEYNSNTSFLELDIISVTVK